MTTEEILRQQIAELEKLVLLKDKRIAELLNEQLIFPRVFQPNPPPYYDRPYWDYTKIYCGASTEGSTNFTASIATPKEL
jgi:hypothetical protein